MADEPTTPPTAPARRSLRWSVLLGVALITALVLLGSGLVLIGGDDPASSRPGSRAAPAATTAPPPYLVAPPVRFKRKPTPTPAPVVAAAPARLLVPTLGIDAPVVGIGAVKGILIPPSNPQVVGWWQYGARPGAAEGGALITGHTVHTGGGAFDDLETLSRGDRVTVRTTRGRIRYRVSGIEIYRKAALAAAADEVFNQRGPGRLVLITCEDWNGTDYESNAVVFADPV